MTSWRKAATAALVVQLGLATLGCGSTQNPGGSVEPRVVVEGTSIFIVDDASGADNSIPIEIPFAVDSDVLDEASHGPLEVLADFLNANGDYTLIEVQGHSDERGTAEYNQVLSTRRAESVVNFLVEHGVDRDRLRAKGFGADRPAARGTSETVYSQNRRVEFVIVKQRGVP